MTFSISKIKVRQLSGSIGAEISGFDLRKDLNLDSAQWLRQLFLDHLVIFFRDQHLSLDQYMAFAKAMGEPIEYPFVKGLDGYPCIIEVKKLEHETVNFGGIWHSDTSYLDIPPMGSMLLGREIPPFGGDTIFANQYLAWETLTPTMQSMLEGLVGINSSAKADVSKTREDRMNSSGKTVDLSEYRSLHPLVRLHPETGRKALYVNIAHTVGIDGLSEQESQSLLVFLFAHQVKVELTCRFVWQVDSLAFWDNRCAQHNPVNDYHGYRRVMHRITLSGDRPR
jgi:taurine dioxygenase